MSATGPDSWEDPAGAEAYAEAVHEGSLYRALAARLVEALAPEGGGRWLDLATGSGIVAERLFARLGPAAAIVGADRSRAMLEVARRALPFAEASFVRADPGALPLAAATFHGAACSAALWHFPALGAAFAELGRVLVPGGRLAITDIVAVRPFTDQERADLAAWAGCVAGAITTHEYVEGLEAAGFSAVEVIPTHPAGPAAVSAVIRATA